MVRRRRDFLARCYRALDRRYLPLDSARHKRAKNLGLVPVLEHRIGGKVSYGEWCHAIGVFQALIAINTPASSGNNIADIGCGTGLLAIASLPFVTLGGHYTGIDVGEEEIRFAKQHYPNESFSFVHSSDHNEAYTSKDGFVSWSNAPSAVGGRPTSNSPNPPKAPVATDDPGATEAVERRWHPWSLENESIDLVTALSVWTHFNEDDALHYVREVGRVLRPGGRAIITLFLLDETFDRRIKESSKALGDLAFTVECCASGNWLTPEWTRVSEDVIGMRPAGLDMLLESSGLKLRDCFPGSWKQPSGVYFQDVTVLEKPS